MERRNPRQTLFAILAVLEGDGWVTGRKFSPAWSCQSLLRLEDPQLGYQLLDAVNNNRPLIIEDRFIRIGIIRSLPKAAAC